VSKAVRLAERANQEVVKQKAARRNVRVDGGIQVNQLSFKVRQNEYYREFFGFKKNISYRVIMYNFSRYDIHEENLFTVERTRNKSGPQPSEIVRC
jgi:hypothetical protein